MKNEALKYGLIGIVIGGAIVWFSATSAVNSNNSGMMGMMGMRSSFQQGNVMNSNTIDAHFIEQMIPHHEDAITMANLALVNAKRVEVKELANNIIDSQSNEITQMEEWYRSWYGKEVPEGTDVMSQHGMAVNGNMHMGMMGDMTDVTNLADSEDFDIAFVEHMIPHHQMAVMMAQMLKNSTQRPEMKELADDIIVAQTKEIDQMRSWLQDWK